MFTSMQLFAIYATTIAHSPNLDDIYRFGFHPEPANAANTPSGISPVRSIWKSSQEYLHYVREPRSPFVTYGREQIFKDWEDEQFWKERCWDALDDLANLNLSYERRFEAAERLKKLLGPVAYYSGQMPLPYTDFPGW